MIQLRNILLITFLVMHGTAINQLAAQSTTRLATENRGAIISSGLRELADKAPVLQRDAQNQFVDVIIEDRKNRDFSTLIQTAGGDLSYRLNHKQQVRIHRNRLKALLDKLPRDVSARLPYPHSENAVISQGVALTGADTMHALNTSGLNVKIGVIDLGFSSLSSSQASGDLPASLSMVDYTGTGTGGSSHGTNVAQIVHDMAPAAELYLAKIGTDLELEIAVNDMIANGVRVINHSVGWFGAAFYDGTGPICNITNTADAAGIVWVNAAGNSRNEHYLGDFSDTNGNLLHEFTTGQDYNTISVNAGVKYTLILNWDDYISQDKVDYDLYIYDGDPAAGGAILAQSTNAQFANFPLPHEILSYIPATTTTLYLAVKKRSASTPDRPLTLFTPGRSLSVRTQSTSLTQPADCASVLSVGATNLSDSPEWFSSEGPTTDGREKPEVSGPDGVITSLNSSFTGTSGSSPHVAGAAALLIQQNPSLDNTGIKNLMMNTSHDVHSTGFDSRTGHGRFSLDADADGYNHDTDNCRLTFNPAQDDLDNDGVGDACEMPVITGFWPANASAGDFVFVFGTYFSTDSSISVNGINADLVQFVSEEMLVFILPEGDTNGFIAVSNNFGTTTSSSATGTIPAGLTINGIWPATATAGSTVFVFGSGFTLNNTQITINTTPVDLIQVVDESLLILIVPDNATTGYVIITTDGDSVTSGMMLTIN